MFPRLGGLRFRFRQNKKAWELTRHSSHGLRPSHCPALLNEQRRSPRRYVYTSPYTNIWHIARCNTPIPVKGCDYYTSRGHLPLQCSRLYWKLRSFDSSRTKRQVNAFILCRDTFIPLTFSPILAQESRLSDFKCLDTAWARVVSVAKVMKKNDYSRIFSWLFCVVRIKTDVWAHKEDLLRPHTILLVF